MQFLASNRSTLRNDGNLLGALIVALFSCCLWAPVRTATAQSGPFLSTNYFPLALGNSWVMRVNGVVVPAMTITNTQLVNFVATMGLSDPSDGSSMYFSNDALGFRLHRIFVPQQFVPGCGTVDESLTFGAPVIVLPASGTLGQAVVTTGGPATLDLGACGFFNIGHNSTSTLQAIERVSVPAGQFDALRVLLSISVFGPGGVVPINSTIWFAQGIGEVRSLDSDGTLTELVSTNIVRTAPDPIALTAQSNVPLSSITTSNSATITGITTAAPVSIVGGEYSINGGAFTNQPGSVTNGQSIQVRLTSAAEPLTTTTATLAVGGIAGTFSATTQVSTPTAPTAVSTSASAGSVIVTFGPPASNGGTAITGYMAACTSSNGGVPGANTGDAGATSIRVSALTDGKSYTCTVAASNSAGAGQASAQSNPVMPFDITTILNLLLMD